MSFLKEKPRKRNRRALETHAHIEGKKKKWKEEGKSKEDNQALSLGKVK